MGYLNDLWRYEGRNLLSHEPIWTWLGGDSIVNSGGNYGVIGVGDASTRPSGRSHSMLCEVGNNQFVLFGGTSSIGVLNDMWTYNASSNIWTWVTGNTTANIAGNYRFPGTQSNLGIIGSRASAGVWVSNNGNVYVFGGASPSGKRNDMWKFSPQEEPDPINDLACGAIAMTLDGATEYGNTAFATSTNDVSGYCYGATNTVWYKYTPNASGFVQFTLGGGLNGDTLNSWVGAFLASGGNCPNLVLADSTVTTLGACRFYYPIGGVIEPKVWSSFLTAGKTYFFRISGITGDIGRYSFSIQSTNITSIASGNWHNPTIWSNNRVPTSQSNVIISYPVTVSNNAICKSLTLSPGTQVSVQNNANLTVLKP